MIFHLSSIFHRMLEMPPTIAMSQRRTQSLAIASAAALCLSSQKSKPNSIRVSQVPCPNLEDGPHVWIHLVGIAHESTLEYHIDLSQLSQ